MLRILSWFGKIRIKLLQKRVLVTVSQLALEAGVALLFTIVLFQGPFQTVLISTLFHG